MTLLNPKGPQRNLGSHKNVNLRGEITFLPMGKVAHENNSKLMQCLRGLVCLAESAGSTTCRPRKDAGRGQLERQVPGGGTTTPSTAMTCRFSCRARNPDF